MSDLDTYLTHCYNLLLKADPTPTAAQDEELCACVTMVNHDENTTH